MIPEPLAEKASLYALGLLQGEEKACFEAKVRKMPELEAMVRQMEDDVSQLALAVPQHSAPPVVWERLNATIHNREVGAVPIAYTPSERSFYRTWAIAATIALTFALILLVYRDDAVRLLHGENGPADVTQREYLNLLGEHDRLAAKAEKLLDTLEKERVENQQREAIIAELDATIGQLENEIENTGTFSSALLERYRNLLARGSGVIGGGGSSKGISRIVVMELNGPGQSASNNAALASSLLADAFENQLLGYIQGQADPAWELNGVTGSHTLPSGSDNLTTGGGGRDSRDTGPMPSEQQAANNNAPVISEDQVEVESNLISEELSKKLRETAESIVDVSNTPSPTGFAIWDPGTQTGSVSLKDVPTVTQDQSLQLWYVDQDSNSPVSIGLLPPLENGAGRVYFSMEDRSITPSRLLLTVEPRGGSSYPSGESILESPKQTGPSANDIITR